MDRGAWWATVHGVTKSWTGLSNFIFTFTFKEQVEAKARCCQGLRGPAESGPCPWVAWGERPGGTEAQLPST